MSFYRISHTDKVAPTPITFVDTAAEVHRLCEEWRALAVEKYTKSLATIIEGKDAPTQLSSFTNTTSSPSARSIRGRYRLGIDLEGRNLGHSGTVDIMAIYDGERNVTYLFDICVLQHQAFTKGPKDEWSLKELIEIGGAASAGLPAAGYGSDKAAHDELVKTILAGSAETAKASGAGTILFLVYDTRMDAAALFHLYGVRLGGSSPSARSSATTPLYGVYDLQVPKCGPKCQWLVGLAKALASYLSYADKVATEKGKAIFVPEMGGDYSQWAARPLNKDLLAYCAVTIRYYVAIFDDLVGTMSVERVLTTTAMRIEQQVASRVPKPDARRDF